VRRQASMVFILISVLINVMGLGLVIPVLPKLIEHLAGGVQAGAYYNGIFIAVYATMQFIFAPILGRLSDRYGRRPVLLAASFGTALDYLIAAVTPALWLLFVARVIAGILGASFSTANAYIADVSKPEERAKNFGLIGAVFGLGFILGPGIGGILGQIDLRLPFYFAALLAFLNGLYGWFVLPESLRPENRNLARGSKNPFAALGILGRTPLLLGLSGSVILINLAFQILQTVWVQYTTYRFEWSILQTSLSLVLVGITAMLVQGGLVRVVVGRLGERRSVLLGQGTGIVSFTLYGLATQGWMMYATILLGSIGNVSQPASQALISRSVSAREQGAVQGALSALVSLTGMVGPLFGGFLLGQVARAGVPSWMVGMPFFVGALLYAVGLLNTWLTFRRVPPGEAEGAPVVAPVAERA
jgi:DHA1 family tetracycline resistance protein-like MFS transporter